MNANMSISAGMSSRSGPIEIEESGWQLETEQYDAVTLKASAIASRILEGSSRILTEQDLKPLASLHTYTYIKWGLRAVFAAGAVAAISASVYACVLVKGSFFAGGSPWISPHVPVLYWVLGVVTLLLGFPLVLCWLGFDMMLALAIAGPAILTCYALVWIYCIMEDGIINIMEEKSKKIIEDFTRLQEGVAEQLRGEQTQSTPEIISRYIQELKEVEQEYGISIVEKFENILAQGSEATEVA